MQFVQYVSAFEYDADNRVAYIGTEKCVKAFYLNARRQFDPLLDYNVAMLTPTAKASALTVNNKLLVAGTSNGELLVFDKTNQALLRDMTSPKQNISAVKFTETKLVSTSEEGHIKLWDVETGTLLEKASEPNVRICRSLQVDTEMNLCMYTSGKQIAVRDLRTWTKIRQIDAAEAYVSCVNFDGHTSKIVAGCTNNRSIAEFKVFDWLSPQPVFMQKVVMWSGDISTVYCDKNKMLYSDPRQIIVIDPSTYKVTKKATVNRVKAMSVQSDFVVLGYENYLGVWSLT